MDSKLIYLIIFLVLSAFFSGTELAFVVANKLKIEVRARRKNLAAQSRKTLKKADNNKTWQWFQLH